MITGNFTISKLGAYGQNQAGFIKNLKGEPAIKKNPLGSASLFTPKDYQPITLEALEGKDPETLFIQTKEALKYTKKLPVKPLSMAMAEASQKSLNDEMNDNLLRAMANKYAQFKSQYLTEDEATANIGNFLSKMAGGFNSDQIGKIDKLLDSSFKKLDRAPTREDVASMIDEGREALGIGEGVEGGEASMEDGEGLEGIVGSSSSAPLREGGLIPDFETGGKSSLLPSSGDEIALQEARARAMGRIDDEEESAAAEAEEEEEEEGGGPAAAAAEASAGYKKFSLSPSVRTPSGSIKEMVLVKEGKRIGSLSASTLLKISRGERLSKTQQKGIKKIREAGIKPSEIIQEARNLGWVV